jgi:diguanylate cyclase (GGDEF)-like protein
MPSMDPPSKHPVEADHPQSGLREGRVLGQLQQEILDMLARGCSVEEMGEHICRLAERLASGVLCSIITVDRGGIIHPLAGPSLSSVYSAALDGVAIGPDVGSCGTAAFLRKAIAVEDIFSDPLWAPYQHLAGLLAEAHGVKACWSSPIPQSHGRVLGAFGFYYRENRGPTPEEQMIVAQCVDLCSLVLEREEIRAENQRLASFDLLTGLGNRANFIRTLQSALEGVGRSLALLLVDIDHLGRVNETFGHATGDRLIREVGRRIAQIVQPRMVFRVDADEFAVLIEGDCPGLDMSNIAKQVLRVMEERFLRSDDHVLALSVTCGGGVSYRSRPADVPEFLRHADLALQHAKQTARGSFVLYSDDLATTIARRFHILQTVTTALAEDRIEAHYQPIVRLDTREIVGLEALCRIRTREGELIPAGNFTEAMQDLSMGSILTDRMLAQVARDVRYWLDQDIPLQHVSVNVSMADFQKGSLRERVSDAFSCQSAPLKHVVLEVTESVYMDESDHRVAQAIEELRAEGMLVALDDFATGYASLTHLLNFPLDIIKIDKSFVDRMPAGGAGEIIIKALLDMAKGLGMRVVAEGVEAAPQALQLERLGCGFAQGFLFGRAVDRDTTTEALRLRARRGLAQPT